MTLDPPCLTDAELAANRAVRAALPKTIFFRIGDGMPVVRHRLWKKRRLDRWREFRMRRSPFCPCELCRLDHGRLAYPRTLMREKAITLSAGRRHR